MINATVYEEQLKQLWDVKQCGQIGIHNNVPCSCDEINCKVCDLSKKVLSGEHKTCHTAFSEWLISEFEPQDCDWTKVPIDAKIRVKLSDSWFNAHFAKYDPTQRIVCFWHGGKTSHTSNAYSYDYVDSTKAQLMEVEANPHD